MTRRDTPSNISSHSTPETSSPKSSGNHFPATKRLKRQHEFAAVFRSGKVVANETLVVHALRSSSETTKLGLSISKKVGNSPQRNYWKRLIREAFRQNCNQIPRGLLLVVRPRRGAAASFQAVEQALRQLTRQLDRQL